MLSICRPIRSMRCCTVEWPWWGRSGVFSCRYEVGYSGTDKAACQGSVRSHHTRLAVSIVSGVDRLDRRHNGVPPIHDYVHSTTCSSRAELVSLRPYFCGNKVLTSTLRQGNPLASTSRTADRLSAFKTSRRREARPPSTTQLGTRAKISSRVRPIDDAEEAGTPCGTDFSET